MTQNETEAKRVIMKKHPQIEGLTLNEDRYLIEPVPVEEKTKGGIILADETKEKVLRKGVILYKGVNQEEKPMWQYIGQVILFSKFSGSTFLIEDKEYLILRQIDIIGGTSQQDQDTTFKKLFPEPNETQS